LVIKQLFIVFSLVVAAGLVMRLLLNCCCKRDRETNSGDLEGEAIVLTDPDPSITVFTIRRVSDQAILFSYWRPVCFMGNLAVTGVTLYYEKLRSYKERLGLNHSEELYQYEKQSYPSLEAFKEAEPELSQTAWSPEMIMALS